MAALPEAWVCADGGRGGVRLSDPLRSWICTANHLLWWTGNDEPLMVLFNFDSDPLAPLNTTRQGAAICGMSMRGTGTSMRDVYRTIGDGTWVPQDTPVCVRCEQCAETIASVTELDVLNCPVV